MLMAHMLPMGFFETIMWPLHWAVSGLLVLAHTIFSPFTGNDTGLTWVLSIVLLTVVIRTLLIPLFVRQIRSTRNMQVIQPKLRELQEKYSHDREKMGMEMQKLYKEEGVNPFASCFPILLQMPIFFALFQVLNGVSRGNPVGTFLIDRPHLIESMQQATIFGAQISETFWPVTDGFGAVQIVAVILIITMTATMFLSQRQLMGKNMPPEAMTGQFAQQQKMMLYLFPLIFAVGGVNFPIGLLIYWTVTNLWSMAQQFYVIRNNPTPNTPAYAAWEERLRAKGHDPKMYKPGQKIPRKPVERFGTAQSGDDATGASDDTQATKETRPKVQRQQPRRQSRSKRRR
ncbi:membrane protein insertase YidC [Propioniferax innocua]|uniref:Membrane protein insertase YidC n=1 Tax=Propioniferax innocua TaxID=1753 RepID=A0A542ZDQ4_9ACTN|nr:membrane protein insertase YidC [Propioniferax innocua]TQL58431.1 YidC/Oxa1 family membrane protein insertase [Propioniferax innocua]